MASVKIKFRPSQQEGKEGTIYYQIICKRVVRQINTPYKILQSDWQKCVGGEYSMAIDDAKSALICSIYENISSDIACMRAEIRKLEAKGEDYTADDIVARFESRRANFTLKRYMAKSIVQLRKLGKIRTSEAYLSTLNSFMAFRESHDILLDEINSDLIMEYEAWLTRRGISKNTASFYNRILRAVYNRAVDEDLTDDRHPFRHVYTGVDSTRKRAVSLESIRNMLNLDLSSDPGLDFARDMFLFSFYTRGMSFVDMAGLRKSDLSGDRLTYRRRKTGKQLGMLCEKCLLDLLGKYSRTDSDYLLPIVTSAEDSKRQYQNSLHLVNHKLKEIGRMINLDVPLTMYVARHSWASAAKRSGASITASSECLGHGSEMTTQIYLASLDSSVLDEVNGIVIKELLKGKQ